MPLNFAHPGSDPDQFYNQKGADQCASCRGPLIPQTGPFGLWQYCPYEECQQALLQPQGPEAARMRRQRRLLEPPGRRNQYSIFD